MKTLGVISQKGGVGKSTLTFNLAVEASRQGKRTIVIDLDPQASTSKVGDMRGEDSDPAIISAQTQRLAQVLANAEKQAVDLCVIDTPATSESNSLTILKASDVVLIPCRTSILDMHSIRTTIELARFVGKEPHVILSMVQPTGSSADEAEAAIVGAYQVQVCPIRIRSLVDFSHALTVGKGVNEYNPKGKAAQQVHELYRWTCGQLGIPGPRKSSVRELPESGVRKSTRGRVHVASISQEAINAQ